MKEWVNAIVGLVKNQIKVCRDYIGWVDKVKEVTHRFGEKGAYID